MTGGHPRQQCGRRRWGHGAGGQQRGLGQGYDSQPQVHYVDPLPEVVGDHYVSHHAG